MNRLALLPLGLVSLALTAGCPSPDPEPLGDTLPGFAPCRAEHQTDTPYEVCPLDEQFPYDEWVPGVIEGNPGLFSDPTTVVLRGEDGLNWNLSTVAHFSLSFDGNRWSSDTLDEAPQIELRVSAPCGSLDHWFAIRSAASGFLLVAGGVSPTASIGDWTVDASIVGDECPEPVTDCPCAEQCFVDPIRFSSSAVDLDLDLYPSERSLVPGSHHALAFSRWTADGPSTCDDERSSGQRWLLLGEED